jgi:hypothetical protein
MIRKLMAIAGVLLLVAAAPVGARSQTDTPANCWWVQSSQPGAAYAELWCRGPEGRAFKTDRRRDQGRDDFTHGCPAGMKYDGMRCVPNEAGLSRPAPAPAPAAAPVTAARPAPASPARGAVRGSLPGVDWRSRKVGRISVRMDNVDDIGLVFVLPASGGRGDLISAEWSASAPGSAHGALSGFGPGRNYVLVLVHNKAFPFGQGKWGMSIGLAGDGRSLWSRSTMQRGGGVGVQYWTAFAVDRTRDGSLTVRPASDGDLTALQPFVDRVDALLVSQAGTETSVLGGMAGALLDGALRETGRGMVRSLSQ